MPRRILHSSIFALILALSASLHAAEFHHVHLLAPDTKAAAEWYAQYMGGTVTKVGGGTLDAAAFGKINIVFKQATAGFPPSDGSTIDHIGFSFPDLDAKMKEFEAAGIKILQPARAMGKIKFGFIVDPNGVKIEVMQDPDLIGFHHVHIHVTDTDATVKWFADTFGGEAVKYGGVLPSVKYSNMWVITQKFPKEKAPTEGRAVDHIGFREDELDKTAIDFKAKGIKFSSDPAPFRDTGAKIAFIEGPSGIKIELVQPPPGK
ncbi:VOC family protein [Candidatus Sumerlaeota bacterium]|nr:VOC family protein [Candidatus Sumerlaeota bacterium]